MTKILKLRQPRLTWLHCLIVILLFVIFLSDDVLASLKINEIYPAPSSGEFEWVEIYNDGTDSVNLTSYFLEDSANKQIRFLSSTIDPQGFVTATSSSILNNDGDTVNLKNNQEEILDFVNYSEKFGSEKSFARCPDGSGSWFILNQISKNNSNNSACQSLTPTGSPEITDVFLPTPILVPQTYNNIYLSEVMVQPKSGLNEWFEIYNDNDFEVNLNNWYIDDLENSGSTPKQFSFTIPAKNYSSSDHASSMFNNDGDSVRLLDFAQNEIDSFQYQSSEKGKTLGRINFSDDTFCLQNPSKGTANNSCINPTSSLKSSPSPVTTLSKTPTPGLSPTGKAKLTTSLKKPAGYLLINQEETGSDDNSSEETEVLGISSENKTKVNQRVLVSSLSFASFSYSLLTIISILIKLKN